MVKPFKRGLAGAAMAGLIASGAMAGLIASGAMAQIAPSKF